MCPSLCSFNTYIRKHIHTHVALVFASIVRRSCVGIRTWPFGSHFEIIVAVMPMRIGTGFCVGVWKRRGARAREACVVAKWLFALTFGFNWAS